MLELNKVYLGDCLEVMRYIESGSVDLILSDLPFGSTKCKWDTPIDLKQLWLEYERVIKFNGAILLFAQVPFDKVLGASNLNMLRYEWIWEKTQATGYQNAKKMPMKAHENILVFYKKLPIYNPEKTSGHVRKVSSAKNRIECVKRTNALDDYLYGKDNIQKIETYDSTERYPRSVLKFKSDKQTCVLHPTQKPVALLEYLIKTYTNVGDLVLDNCVGSGSTCVAAINTKRQFLGIEKEEKYFDIAKERIERKLN